MIRYNTSESHQELGENVFTMVCEELVHYNKGIVEKLKGRIWVT